MPLLLATIRGDLRAAMEAEIRDVARAMRRGVEHAGREVQAELRAQARGASSRDGLRVTPAEMKAARGEAFIIRSKSNPAVRLWCLRVRGASSLSKRRRLRLFVGANVEVLTGHRRGQQRLARATLAQGFVPMFFLMRQVRLDKRLDVAGVRRRAGNVLARAIVAELARDA